MLQDFKKIINLQHLYFLNIQFTDLLFYQHQMRALNPYIKFNLD